MKTVDEIITAVRGYRGELRLRTWAPIFHSEAETLFMEIERLRAAQGDWISCLDRLPDNAAAVLVVKFSGEVREARFDDGHTTACKVARWWVNGRIVRLDEVTHWRPMLAAPTPEMTIL